MRPHILVRDVSLGGSGQSLAQNGQPDTRTPDKVVDPNRQAANLGFGVPYFNTFFLKGTLME